MFLNKKRVLLVVLASSALFSSSSHAIRWGWRQTGDGTWYTEASTITQPFGRGVNQDNSLKQKGWTISKDGGAKPSEVEVIKEKGFFNPGTTPQEKAVIINESINNSTTAQEHNVIRDLIQDANNFGNQDMLKGFLEGQENQKRVEYIEEKQQAIIAAVEKAQEIAGSKNQKPELEEKANQAANNVHPPIIVANPKNVNDAINQFFTTIEPKNPQVTALETDFNALQNEDEDAADNAANGLVGGSKVAAQTAALDTTATWLNTTYPVVPDMVEKSYEIANHITLVKHILLPDAPIRNFDADTLPLSSNVDTHTPSEIVTSLTPTEITTLKNVGQYVSEQAQAIQEQQSYIDAKAHIPAGIAGKQAEYVTDLIDNRLPSLGVTISVIADAAEKGILQQTPNVLSAIQSTDEVSNSLIAVLFAPTANHTVAESQNTIAVCGNEHADPQSVDDIIQAAKASVGSPSQIFGQDFAQNNLANGMQKQVKCAGRGKILKTN